MRLLLLICGSLGALEPIMELSAQRRAVSEPPGLIGVTR